MNTKLSSKRNAFVKDMLSLIPPKYLSTTKNPSLDGEFTSQNKNLAKQEVKHCDSSNDPTVAVAGHVEPELYKTISVLIRGDISSRIFSTWARQLPRRCKILDSSFRNNFDKSSFSTMNTGSNIVVLPTTCEPTVALSFLLSTEDRDENEIKRILRELLTGAALNAPLLTNPKYIVDSITAGYLLDPRDPKYQHSLQKELLSTSITAAGGEDLAEKSGQNTPILVSLPNKDVEITQPQNSKSSKDSYLCARPPPNPSLPAQATGNGNASMIKMLEELKGVYAMQGDEWRTLGYKKALVQLKKMPTITSVEQLNGVKGIGKRLREKIGEILESGALKKLKYLQDDPKTQGTTYNDA
jgi:hypothetical protein